METFYFGFEVEEILASREDEFERRFSIHGCDFLWQVADGNIFWQNDGSAVGIEFSGDDFEERRFSGAIVTDEGCSSKTIELPCDVFEQFLGTEVLGKIRYLKHNSWNVIEVSFITT